MGVLDTSDHLRDRLQEAYAGEGILPSQRLSGRYNWAMRILGRQRLEVRRLCSGITSLAD